MEKVQTLHPEPSKRGVRINKEIYDLCKQGILYVLREAGGEVTHTELLNRLEEKLKGKMKGSIGWYGETVKLDLEARKIIKRLPGSPQRIQLVQK